MAGFIDFLLIFIFLVVPLVGITTQLVPLRLDNVIFRDTAPTFAWQLVAQYALGTFEQRFGYPTGYFYPDEKRSQQGERLLMKEAQPTGAITDGCSMQVGSLGTAGLEAGCGAGCLWFCMIMCIGAPFFAISFLDRFCRLLLRSRVDVRFTTSGPDAIASLRFYGPGGYALRKQYVQAFAKPELPLAVAGPAVQPPATGLGPQPAGSAA